MNVKAFASDAVPRPGLARTTSTGPAAPAAVTAVTDDALLTVTLAASLAPKRTVALAAKPEPLRVTLVPPEVEPEPGSTLVRIGAPA